MRVPSLFAAAIAFTLVGGFGAIGAQEHQHPAEGGAHRHPEAGKILNPVKPNETSIAAGKKLYDSNCSQCHGLTGQGDGKMAAMVDPKPSNLVDAESKHGSSDGEMFVVIRDGVKGTGMKGFGSKMTAHQMWDVINYLHSIGARSSH